MVYLCHFFNGFFSFVFGRYGVDLVEDNDHSRAGDLSYDQTLSRLSLYTLGDVHHQNHQVNDLSTPDDRLDKRRMTGTVN